MRVYSFAKSAGHVYLIAEGGQKLLFLRYAITLGSKIKNYLEKKSADEHIRWLGYIATTHFIG